MRKLLYLSSFLFLLACNSTEQKESTTEWVDPNTIKEGPIQHDSLTSDQLSKISYLYDTFKEVDPSTKEKWIEDFKRDLNPDREIEVWMMMANAYKSYCDHKELKPEVKKEVYQVVLLRSSAPPEEVLDQLVLNYISEAEAKKIMEGYTLEAKPIRVIGN